MGNHPSGPGGDPSQVQQSSQQNRSREGIRNLLRNNGALGLSKAELDARCQPTGLYSSCPWDYKQIRRLIGDGKLAARVKGTEDRESDGDSECPICFFYYSAVNKTKCCQAFICTECYLQVRNPKESSTACPFCNQKLLVTMSQPLSEEAIEERKAEEQKTIEAKIRASSIDIDTSSFSDTSGGDSTKSPPPTLNPLSQPPNNPGFGASLEQNERVALMRKRSTSGSSVDPTNTSFGDSSFTPTPEAVAMTPEERQALEAEMKAQHNHPLARRIEQEEEERRFRNQQEYITSPQYQQRVAQQQRLREMQARRLLMHAQAGGAAGGGSRRVPRDWNRIVEAFESGTAGNSVQSLDDLVVLEAAIMLSSMDSEQQQRQQGEASGNSGGGGSGNGSNNSSSHNRNAATSGSESIDDFAARHARAGFPVARARVGGSNEDALLSSAGNSRVRQRHLQNAQPWMMAALMSEEEQMAMAIAASLRDAPPPNIENENQNDAENNDAAEAANNNETANDVSADENDAVNVEQTDNTTSPAEETGDTNMATAEPELDTADTSGSPESEAPAETNTDTVLATEETTEDEAPEEVDSSGIAGLSINEQADEANVEQAVEDSAAEVISGETEVAEPAAVEETLAVVSEPTTVEEVAAVPDEEPKSPTTTEISS